VIHSSALCDHRGLSTDAKVQRRSRIHPAQVTAISGSLDPLQSDPDIEIIAPLLVPTYVFGDMTIRTVAHPLF
jgi:hypothetical protein